jgi:hypothetical protein
MKLWKLGQRLERALGREVSDAEVERAIRSIPRHFAANKVQYASGSVTTEQGRRGRSAIIWKDFPVAQVSEDPTNGAYFMEDFLCLGGTVIASTAGNYFGNNSAWHSFESSGSSVLLSGTDVPNQGNSVSRALGVVKLRTAATDDLAVGMELGGGPNQAGAGLGAFGVGSTAAVTVPTPGSLPKLVFECRVRWPQVASGNVFLGLAVPNQTSAANTVFSTSNAIVNSNMIGFYTLAAAASTINAVYGVAAGVPTSVGTGTAPSTAANFTKLGFIFDPMAVYPLRYYQDGVLLGQKKLSEITAAAWPSNVALNPLIYALASTTTVTGIDVDWIAVGQLMGVE